jgi:hypothetical protein
MKRNAWATANKQGGCAWAREQDKCYRKRRNALTCLYNLKIIITSFVAFYFFSMLWKLRSLKEIAFFLHKCLMQKCIFLSSSCYYIVMF